MAYLRNLGYGSFKVIENVTIG